VISEIDELLTALRESAWDKKTEALRTLTAKLAAGEVSEEHEGTVIPLIVAAARDPKWEVQKAAAVALSELRPLLMLAWSSQRWKALARDQQTHYVKEALSGDSSASGRERSGRKSGSLPRTRATQPFSTS